MGRPAGYTHEELARAVAGSRSWRGVLRALGRPPASAGTYRSVRRRVEALGIDHSHFTGQRTWSDADLVAAVGGSRSWLEVVRRLGLSDASGNLAGLRGHAVRLGLDTGHLAAAPVRAEPVFTAPARADLLRVAGPSLAAAWFQLRGYEVLWPQEGCRYDLAVRCGGGFVRVQVKTTTYRPGGRHLAQISGTRGDRQSAYDVDEVDQFFVVDGDLDAYLIPYRVVAGRTTLSLTHYAAFRVSSGGAWLGDAATSCASRGP